MRRYDIVKGDKTTAGGTVMAGDSHDRIHDQEQAYEHDPIWCPVCRSVGTLVCTGPRLSSTGPDGREAALSDDLCVCQCEPSPRLLASQYVSYIDTRDAPQSGHRSRFRATANIEYDEQVCPAGNGVSKGYPFFIETPGGYTHFGRLDSEGNLPRIYSAYADDYVVFWGDEALERQVEA
ncbi:PAAR domain-containing protein [Burkholderia sp. 22PA0099]|uniref:PAAR domain-containing protein n=1 Tax=Burkholderia sp. 22PA0099 TaxID=3237372 RepID=UPI0039C4944E